MSRRGPRPSCGGHSPCGRTELTLLGGLEVLWGRWLVKGGGVAADIGVAFS